MFGFLFLMYSFIKFILIVLNEEIKIEFVLFEIK